MTVIPVTASKFTSEYPSIQEHDVALQTRELSTGNASAGDASGNVGLMRVWYARN